MLPAKCQLTRPLVAKPQRPVILLQLCQAALSQDGSWKAAPRTKSFLWTSPPPNIILLSISVPQMLPSLLFKSHAWLKGKQVKILHLHTRSSYRRSSSPPPPPKYSRWPKVINITASSLALLCEFTVEVPKVMWVGEASIEGARRQSQA